MKYEAKNFIGDLRSDMEAVESELASYRCDKENIKNYMHLKEAIYTLCLTIKHEAVNGTLSTLDAEKMKEYFWGLLL